MIVKARYGITFAKLNSTYEFEIVNSTDRWLRGGSYFFNSATFILVFSEDCIKSLKEIIFEIKDYPVVLMNNRDFFAYFSALFLILNDF